MKNSNNSLQTNFGSYILENQKNVITIPLAENIIQTLVEYLSINYINKGKDISKLAIVFGGKRPSLFVKKYLTNIIGKSYFPPQFFSMEEFVDYIFYTQSNSRQIHSLDAAFIVYNLSKDLVKEFVKNKTFAQFLPWAYEILSFIEQLDLEDISNDQLKKIQDLAKIGFQDIPKYINKLFQKIVKLREMYHQKLQQYNFVSRGRKYYFACLYCKDTSFDCFEKILFCNLFYLHKTEKSIIKTLLEKRKAMLFLQGGQQEWSILEDLAKSLNIEIKPAKEKTNEYKLYFYSAFDTHSQISTVREIVKQIDNLDTTVIVIPKAENVIPLLSEISSITENFNVSLGYPLNRAPLYPVIKNIFESQLTYKSPQYYTKNYLKTISHPIIKNLSFFNNPIITSTIVHKIEEYITGIENSQISGKIFITLNEIEQLDELYTSIITALKNVNITLTKKDLQDIIFQLHTMLFYQWEKIDSLETFVETMKILLHFIDEKTKIVKYPLNLKFLEKILQMLEELKNAIFVKEKIPKEDIFEIFDILVSQEIISFSGSPLKGLQILGVLETRSLCFDNVIVMDLNEGVFPKIKLYEPLIPKEIMLKLGLSRTEKEEEIQRYYFRSLISAAKNVYLIFEETKDKERSRFVEQLLWELELKEKKILSDRILKVNFQLSLLPQNVEIRKKDYIIDYLKNFVFSYSSINTYLNCPLQFYYKYILKLEEKEDIFEEIEAVDIGRFLHEFLHSEFYKFKNTKPVIDTVFEKNFLNNLSIKFDKYFGQRSKTESYLLKEIILYRMKKFIDNEKERQNNIKKILCLEEQFHTTLKISTQTYTFKAVIDRIDLLENDTLYVIDYKTGSSDIMTKNLDKLSSVVYDRREIRKVVKSFQIPLYFAILKEKFSNYKINAGLYNLKESTLKDFFTEKDQGKEDMILEISMNLLGKVLEELYNPEIPFVADKEDVNICKNCSFFYLCK